MKPYYGDGFLRTDAFSKNDAGIIVPMESVNKLNDEILEALEKNKEKLNSGIPAERIIEREEKLR